MQFCIPHPMKKNKLSFFLEIKMSEFTRGTVILTQPYKAVKEHERDLKFVSILGSNLFD